MTEKHFRLFLTIIFMTGASVLIYNKFNQGVESLNNKIDSTKSVAETVKQNLNIDNKKNIINNTDVPTIKPDEASHFSTLVGQCTDFNTRSLNSLNDLSSQLEINNINPSKIIRNNYIYNIDQKELRISLFPSEKLNTWNVEEYSVDNEGLPIPGSKIKFKSYNLAIQHINTNYPKESLGTTENDIKYSYNANTGKALIINGKLVKITNHNSKLSLTLECENKNCICNKF